MKIFGLGLVQFSNQFDLVVVLFLISLGLI